MRLWEKGCDILRALFNTNWACVEETTQCSQKQETILSGDSGGR